MESLQQCTQIAADLLSPVSYTHLYFRGSGNDMTRVQMEELLEFVKSGYPVVLGSSLVNGSRVNAGEVDTSSYYYEFLSEAIAYDNVCLLYTSRCV